MSADTPPSTIGAPRDDDDDNDDDSEQGQLLLGAIERASIAIENVIAQSIAVAPLASTASILTSVATQSSIGSESESESLEARDGVVSPVSQRLRRLHRLLRLATKQPGFAVSLEVWQLAMRAVLPVLSRRPPIVHEQLEQSRGRLEVYRLGVTCVATLNDRTIHTSDATLFKQPPVVAMQRQLLAVLLERYEPLRVVVSSALPPLLSSTAGCKWSGALVLAVRVRVSQPCVYVRVRVRVSLLTHPRCTRR